MSKKILIIEDEHAVRENIVDCLTLNDYEVFDTDDGYKAIELAVQFQPDLILCDIMMPAVDGYNVLLALQQNPKTATIPFIFLTAMAERNDQRLGMELGADDYLIKPFTFDELLQAVKTRLRKRSNAIKKLSEEVQELYEGTE
ncbi:MAG: response regulator [Cyanobacteria bacterium P01_D01_bin.123]